MSYQVSFKRKDGSWGRTSCPTLTIAKNYEAFLKGTMGYRTIEIFWRKL